MSLAHNFIFGFCFFAWLVSSAFRQVAEAQDTKPLRESFDQLDANRFLTKIPNKNTEVRDGVLWTRGSSGGKYPPMIYLPVEGVDMTISFRYRHLEDGGMIWFFVDGDDGFGSTDHMLRVKLLRKGVQLQVDSHSLDPNHPGRQKKGRPADPVSKAYRLNEFLPLESVDLSSNQWRKVRISFRGEMVQISVDQQAFYTTLARPCFNAAKRKLLWMQKGGEKGIELDDIKIEASTKEDEFTSLFNGKDLAGWDGNPDFWKVKDGIVTGTCDGPDSLKDNTFLIWRGGKVKDFELRATVRVEGDNNSGIQYRSREMPELGPWIISGYQCDIHPAIEHTGMTYEEKGRGIFGLNGSNVILDPEGERWLLSEHEPVKVDVSKWNEYTVIARGNHLIHKINGQVSSELIDHHDKGSALEGLLAIQLHRGNPNSVQIKDLRIKTLSDGELVPFDRSKYPPDMKKVERPRTKSPQGTGPVIPSKK